MGKGYEETNSTEFASSASERSNGGEGEGDNREELAIQRVRNRRGKERRVCRSCICEEDQGGCGRMKQLERGGSRVIDLKGLRIWCWDWGWYLGGA